MKDFENIVLSEDRKKAWKSSQIGRGTKAAREGRTLLRPYLGIDLSRETDRIKNWTAGYNGRASDEELARSGRIALSSYGRARTVETN